jgi:retinol-binding protein 3
MEISVSTKLDRTLGSHAVLILVLAALTSPLALAAPASVAPAAQDAGSGLKLPENEAGRCVTAFLEMLADPTPERVTAFENAHRSPNRMTAVPMPDRINLARQIRDDLGKLTLHDVVSVDENAISITADGGRGRLISVDFEFDAEYPGKLDKIGVTLACGPGRGAKAEKLTPERRKETVEGVAKAVDENYVYPEAGRKLADAIRGHLKAGDYDQIEDDAALTRRLTDDLRAVTNDRHLGVRLVQAAPAGPSAPDGPSTPIGPSTPRVADFAGENSAFRKVEVLPGNIGYVRFDAFVDGTEAQETAAAALAFLAHCNALIFDLRHNGGGSPEAIRFITSYLFDSRTHLNDMIDRSGKVVEEYWTLETVPGRRFAKDLPVFVLTSSYTFSGAEEFCYNLQNLKRATVVGEKTGGGAHPVRGVRINDRIVAAVPFMRACNPVSKTNWEGVGVQPDVPTKADEALDRAVELARKASRERNGSAAR